MLLPDEPPCSSTARPDAPSRRAAALVLGAPRCSYPTSRCAPPQHAPALIPGKPSCSSEVCPRASARCTPVLPRLRAAHWLRLPRPVPVLLAGAVGAFEAAARLLCQEVHHRVGCRNPSREAWVSTAGSLAVHQLLDPIPTHVEVNGEPPPAAVSDFRMNKLLLLW